MQIPLPLCHLTGTSRSTITVWLKNHEPVSRPWSASSVNSRRSRVTVPRATPGRRFSRVGSTLVGTPSSPSPGCGGWPGKLKAGLKGDKGVDLVAETRDKQLVAIQVKFRRDPNDPVPPLRSRGSSAFSWCSRSL